MLFRRNTYFIVLVGLTNLFFLFSSACSGKREGTRAGQSSVTSENGTKSFAKLTSSRELFNNLSVILNIRAGTDDTLATEFKNLYPTLPQNGDSAFSSSSSRMFTNFTVKLCRQARAAEAGLPVQSRTVFKFVDLVNPPATVAGTDRAQRMSAFIKHIAARFYGMEIPLDEFQIIQKFYETHRSLVTQNQAGAQQLAEDICGLIGSTPRALIRM